MKLCYRCGCTKEKSLFGVNKSKSDGLATECRECKRSMDRDYAKRNAEKANKRASLWYYKNRDNPEYQAKAKQRLKDWRASNLARHAAKANKRRALKLQAMPKWLSEEQINDINNEYALCKWCTEVMGTPYHVDHIVPLKGKNVCGLHVAWNLRVIPARDNIIKGNRHVG